MEIEYSHKSNGGYAETIATIDQKRKFLVDTQYGTIFPIGNHALDGVDTEALILDARKNGKFGSEPKPIDISISVKNMSRVCPKCQTYCFGDCET